MSGSVAVPLIPCLSACHTPKKTEGKDRLRFGAEEYEVALQLLSLSGVASYHELKSVYDDASLGSVSCN